MTERSMTNVDSATMKASGWTAVKGDPGKLVCLSKATFEGEETSIMKSIKAVEVAGGCLVFVTTEHSKLGLAEAVTFVPGLTMGLAKMAFGT